MAATRIQAFWRRYRSWKLRQEQPKEGHPPTKWEADTVEGAEGANDQCLTQQGHHVEVGTDQEKGDAGRRCAALGDMAEADRVFALRLAGLG